MRLIYAYAGTYTMYMSYVAGTYSTVLSATSLAQCVSCPAGTTTLNSGTATATSCVTVTAGLKYYYE